MNGKAAKEHRKTAREGALSAVRAVGPALDTINTNELLTRKRVDELEAFRNRGFRGRLRWLLTGR